MDRLTNQGEELDSSPEHDKVIYADMILEIIPMNPEYQALPVHRGLMNNQLCIFGKAIKRVR